MAYCGRIVKILLTGALLIASTFLCVPADGMGVITVGGSISAGVSLSELSDDVSRPLSPVNSMLLDENHSPVIPTDNRTGIAQWEVINSGKVRLSISPGIVISESSGETLTAEKLMWAWESRKIERWDANWALRGIEEFQVFDNHTLDLVLKPGIVAADVLKALKSPALRLSFSGPSGPFDGTGPFKRWMPSVVRHRFAADVSHFAGRPYVDEVNIIAYPSAEESVLDFGRGSLDALILTSNELGRYSGSSRAEPSRVSVIGTAVILLIFNPVMLPDLNERKALAAAVDRDSIAQVVLGEGASIAVNFSGSDVSAITPPVNPVDARELYSLVENPKDRLGLLVPDDPAARDVAGRLRANWESLGVPVDLIEDSGPLKLSMNADIIMVSIRLDDSAEGVLPECLTLYDRNGWWEYVGLAMPSTHAEFLRATRSLDISADLAVLGSALQDSGLAVPLVKYEILFAPGPDLNVVPQSVFPGTAFWRTWIGPNAVNRDNSAGNGNE